jgi:hypothetical protein
VVRLLRVDAAYVRVQRSQQRQCLAHQIFQRPSQPVVFTLQNE